MLENLIMVAHILVAVCLIILVLLQRSEGGMGALGGSGGGALMSGQSVGNAMERATKILAALFFCLSLALAYMHMGNSSSTSVVDTVTLEEQMPTAPAASDVAPAPSMPVAPLEVK